MRIDDVISGPWRKLLFTVLVLSLVVLSTPALPHLPELVEGGVQTLAPLVREVTPSVVNISVHGRIKEENPLYRDPLFREFFDAKTIGTRVSGCGLGRDCRRGSWLRVDSQSCG